MKTKSQFRDADGGPGNCLDDVKNPQRFPMLLVLIVDAVDAEAAEAVALSLCEPVLAAHHHNAVTGDVDARIIGTRAAKWELSQGMTAEQALEEFRQHESEEVPEETDSMERGLTMLVAALKGGRGMIQ